MQTSPYFNVIYLLQMRRDFDLELQAARDERSAAIEREIAERARRAAAAARLLAPVPAPPVYPQPTPAVGYDEEYLDDLGMSCSQVFPALSSSHVLRYCAMPWAPLINDCSSELAMFCSMSQTTTRLRVMHACGASMRCLPCGSHSCGKHVYAIAFVVSTLCGYVPGGRAMYNVSARHHRNFPLATQARSRGGGRRSPGANTWTTTTTSTSSAPRTAASSSASCRAPRAHCLPSAH